MKRLLLLLAACSVAHPRAPAVTSVGCIAMTVTDMERARGFFTDVLQFDQEMHLGRECVELRAGQAVPEGSRSNDRWFQHLAIVVSDMDRAFARLEERGVPRASRAPQTLPDWNRNAAGIRAYYFKGPDNHTLEIISFPAGKGDPRWQSKGALFLGIDHTALVVADTEASLRFYQGQLGLRIAGGSENYGPEQEALNDVPGARLRITTLRAARGPGIELLEYLAPRTGKTGPAAYWTTTLLGAHAATLRDPDGHLMEIMTP